MIVGHRRRSQPRDPDLAARCAPNVRRIREDTGLSVPDLARRAKLDRRTVANLEAGRSAPTFATLRQIADALRVPVGELVADG